MRARRSICRARGALVTFESRRTEAGRKLIDSVKLFTMWQISRCKVADHSSQLYDSPTTNRAEQLIRRDAGAGAVSVALKTCATLSRPGTGD